MRRAFDRVVLSSNEHPNYIGFWPLVARAWRTLFDGVPVSLALVTRRSPDDPVITEMSRHGEVVLFPEIEGVPSANRAKVARHILASRHGSAVCLINDVDLLPLQQEYVNELLSHRRPGQVLCVGADVYCGSPEEGKFPIGYLTAEGDTLAELINPLRLSDEALVRSWIGLRVFDHKEDVSRSVHNEDPDTFSDESLFRALIHRWNRPCRVLHRPRGFSPYTARAVDRAAWELDRAKLASGVYVEAHLSRPFDRYVEQFRPLIEHLKQRDVHAFACSA